MISDFEACQRLLEKHAPPARPRLPDPADIRALAIRQVLHKKRGQGGWLPRYAVDMMKAEYDRLGTLEAVAKRIGITPQTVSKHFKARNIPFGPPPNPRIFYNGHWYRFRGDHYYIRCGAKNNVLLHKVAWEDRHGPLNGNRLIYLTKNYADVSDNNLKMLTPKEYQDYLHHCNRTKSKKNEKVL